MIAELRVVKHLFLTTVEADSALYMSPGPSNLLLTFLPRVDILWFVMHYLRGELNVQGREGMGAKTGTESAMVSGLGHVF
jgi:hypothetical protein